MSLKKFRFVRGNYNYETRNMIGILGHLKWESILNVQGDTAISLCRERTLARRRALAFGEGVGARGGPGSGRCGGALDGAARAHIVERTSVNNSDSGASCLGASCTGS